MLRSVSRDHIKMVYTINFNLNINVIIRMVAILDVCKLGNILYLGFN